MHTWARAFALAAKFHKQYGAGMHGHRFTHPCPAHCALARRLGTMSEKQLMARARRITNVGKLASFIKVGACVQRVHAQAGAYVRMHMRPGRAWRANACTACLALLGRPRRQHGFRFPAALGLLPAKVQKRISCQ